MRSRFRDVERSWRPPPKLSLSEWAERHYYLSADSSAEAGRWRSFPYQRGIMDAITDPSVERITWMKSARVGATKIMNAAIGYFMEHDPCPILLVQPTVEDAQGYSKEEIAPMLRDCPALAALVREPTAKISEQTILHKSFPGGILSMVGANSGRGFRRVSRRVVLFDEVDAYPASAGSEGDQIRLGIRRTEFYWNRKIIAASTPLVAGASRIEEMFEAGDQRRYLVPCPHCGHRDVLSFRQKTSDRARGHWMQWPEGEPELAYFVCSENGCVIEHHSKVEMIERGEWVAQESFTGHASFHIWAAYSLSPNATWGQIAKEWCDAQGKAEQLKTVVNTLLGETWREVGEVPDYELIYARREPYTIGSVPKWVGFLTQGVDVQKDRLVYEVTGWRAENKESWSVDAGIIWGDTALDATWAKLNAQVDRTYPCHDGGEMAIRMTAIDSGAFTQQVYAWARTHPMDRVIACKGVTTERALIGTPSPVDVTVRGKPIKRGYKVWPVGVDMAKSQLYGWLRMASPADGDPFPGGWCHFPEYDQEYFRQLTAEQLICIVKRSGFKKYEWHVIPGRENHYLDCRVLSRAAASVLGIDRASKRRETSPEKPPAAPPSPSTPGRVGLEQPRKPAENGGGWLSGGRRPGGWLGRR